MNKIRVLHVIRSMNMGGAQVIIMNLYKNINKDNVQFDFLANEKGVFDDEIIQMGGKIYYMPYLTDIGPLKYSKQLKNFFREHSEYKIVHSHINQVSGFILENAKKSNIPIRIAHAHSTNNNNNILIKLYKRFLQNKINKSSNYRFACSNEAGKWLYSNSSFEIIKNGVEIEKFKNNIEKRNKKRTELGIDKSCIVIGNVGRFSKVKNHEYMLEIFSKFRKKNNNTKLLLIGDGELKDFIIEKAKNMRIYEDIIFKVENQFVEDYYNVMDIYICPSLYEGIPLTLIEAQVNGLPILASNTIDYNVKLSSNFIFEDLNNIDNWINDLEKFKEYKKSDENIKEIEKAGYNIKIQAEKLEKFYCKMNAECQEE